MKLIVAEPTPTFIPRDKSLMVACPPGCVRGKVYFDTDAVSGWMRSRHRLPTIEALYERLICGVCGERPAEVRVITKLLRTKLATLPGMTADGRSMLENKKS